MTVVASAGPINGSRPPSSGRAISQSERPRAHQAAKIGATLYSSRNRRSGAFWLDQPSDYPDEAVLRHGHGGRAAYRQQRCCYDDTRQTIVWPIHDDVSSARLQGRVAAVSAGRRATGETRRLQTFPPSPGNEEVRPRLCENSVDQRWDATFNPTSHQIGNNDS